MDKKTSTIQRFATLCVIILLFPVAAKAASITYQPLTPTYTVGTDPITIKVVGRNFDPGTNGSATGGTKGGGFSVGWDPAILSLNSVNMLFPGDQIFGNSGTLDAAVGTLSNVSVTSWFGTALANFDIAELNFSFLGVGTTSTNIGISSVDVWADNAGFVDMTPNAIGGSVTIAAAPIPPAFVLFGFGVASLGVFSRRKRVSVQGC